MPTRTKGSKAKALLGATLLLTGCGQGPGSDRDTSIAQTSQALAGLALDKLVVTHQGSASSSISAPGLTTTQAGELVLAFIASDGPSPGTQKVNAVTGTGLTFRLRQRTNTQAGTAEIWQAVATSTLSNVVVKATRASSYSGSIVVAAFAGADTAVDGATGTGNGNGTTGGPTASLVPTRAGSQVWGVGCDWSRAVARTLGTGQTKDDEYLAPAGDTFWVQHQTAPAAAAGAAVTLNDTAPTNDLYNLSLIEIRPAVPPDSTPPTAPANLVGVASSPTRVDLSWDASTDNVAVTGYQVFRDAVRLTTTTGTTFSDTGVTGGSTHHYVVYAVDAAGNLSTVSNDVGVTTPTPPPDTTPPTAPGNLVATPLSATRVDLSWVASADDVAVTGYQVFRDAALIATTTLLVYSDTSLLAQSTHDYQVFAVDAAGNVSPGSSDVTVTTPATPPDTTPPTVAMTSPSAGATVSGNVTLTATASDNIGVVGVQFSVDGVSLGAELTAPPYSTLWATSGLANGAHTIGVRARDAAGNQTNATGLSVNLFNAGDPAQVGTWGPLLAWPEVSIHQALTYTGKILTFQGDFTQGGEQYILDPTPATYTRVPNAAVDLFCAGQAVTADGRILVIGGTATQGGLGIKAITAFNPATELWEPLAPMHYARWYATGTTLGDGRILVTAGDDKSSTDLVPIPEIYDVQHNTWSDLAGASLSLPVYPFMYQLPDGRVLQAGASEELTSTRVLDIALQRWTTVDSRLIDGATMCNYATNKFIRVGSASDGGFTGTSLNTAYTLDMSQPNPTWQATTPMAFRRSFANLTSLPDGMVLVTGGGTDRSGYIDANGVLAAEQWNPATGTWTTLASMTAPRLYHSGAVLLPDGRVFVSGGGGDTGVSDQRSYQIFSPPYLFKGARPTFTGVPSLVQYNSTVSVQTPDAARIARVSLIRTGSVTHSFDQNARALSLTFVASATGIDVDMPHDGNTAPPGYYLLFIVDTNGVPSVGAFVRFPAPYEDLVPPSAPGTLSALGDIGVVSLSWLAATDNLAVASYDVFRSTTPGFTPSLANRVATGITTTALNDLVAAGTYYYRVEARDAAGNLGPASDEAQGTSTLDAIAPSAPTSLTAPSVGATQVSLNWGAATDNVGLDHYAVVRDGVTIATLGPSVTAYVDAPVLPGTAYAYSVVAFDTTGNASAPSNTVNVTTQASTGLSVAFQVVTHQASSSTTLLSPAFTTTLPNTLLIALMSSDTSSSKVTFSTVTGGGLSWRLRQRTNNQLGTAEIWQAVAVSPISGAVATATRTGGAAVGAMMVVGFVGADTAADGAVGTGDATKGAPTAQLTSTRAGSQVWGVGTDYDRAVARTVGSNSTKVDEYLAPTDDTYWVERLTNPVASAGLVVKLADTAPTGDRFDFSLIEIRPAP